MKKKKTTYKEFIEFIETYLSEDDVKKVKNTYDYVFNNSFAKEEYLEHSLNVASILTDIKADRATLCTALLHKIYKNIEFTEEITKKFDEEIILLLEGVSKIEKLNFDLSNDSAISMQKKILVGLTKDVRVIIIRLAERIDEMRNLGILPEKEQKEIANETLQILTPIAHRLGMNQYKSELEDLSLRYSKNDIYFDIVDKLNQTKAERDNSVKKMIEEVSKLLDNASIKHEIKGRSKSIYSIYKKLDKGKKFSEIYDLLALRIFVDTEAECYQTLGIIHSKFKPKPKRFKDYIAMPKTNMYQSLHTTVFGLDGFLYEIQIRTYEMDEIAERGVASHWSYKEQGTNKLAQKNLMEDKLQFFRSIIELNNEEINDHDFVSSIKDEFSSTIYVFTPKGDVVELPKGATPIDFAYKVHSGVGDKMVGAIVNDNIVPLDYELKNEDIIKINTNKNSIGPSREWIGIAKTPKAKNKIRSFFKKIDKEEYQKRGEELLNKELHKKKISYQEFFSVENIKMILDNYKLSDIEELYLEIGSNKISPISVINIINGENDSKEDILLKKVISNKESTIKKDVIVDGIDNIKLHLSSCCKPIPGDSIVGFITKGCGISVHRRNCPNIDGFNERIIDVYWGDISGKKYESSIFIKTEKKENILLEIISKASNNNINIKSINTYQLNDMTTFELVILVENLEILNKFIQHVNSIDAVFEIERIVK